MGSLIGRAGARGRVVAVLAFTAVVSAGCIGAGATHAPSSGSPAASGSASAPSNSSASPYAWPTTAPTLPTIDLAKVPLAPAGPWKSIRWVAVPAAPDASANPTPDDGGITPETPEPQLAGWSRGYVGFTLAWTGDAGINTMNTITPTYSADGVHWHNAPVFQDKTTAPVDAIRAVYEGPAGLLAVGEAGACGDTWVESLITSTDGITWKPVDMKKAFGKSVIWNVSGGSKGFVATDTIGQKVWTSRDGRTWQAVNLGTPAFTRSRIDDGTAFSGGMVIVGSTQLLGARSCGAFTVDPSAPATPEPPKRVPAAWWSADGATWTKADLPGAKTDYQIHMWVWRLDDNTLAVFGESGQWLSHDGRTWTAFAESVNPFVGLNFVNTGYLQTDGRHGVQLQAAAPIDTDPYAGGMALSVWNGNGLAQLTQSGDQPPYDYSTHWAVGPTGVVVTNRGQLWIGLPSN